MLILKLLLSALIGYFLGSTNFSILISEALGGDIRKKGSGNPGATNVARIYGIGMGVATLVGDFIKTIISILIAKALVGDIGVISGGFSSLLGHCYPAFHDFKGGKGISCGAAIALMINWRVFLSLAAIFLCVAFASRKVSLGSVCAAAALPVLTAVFHCGAVMTAACAVGAAFVIFRHRTNIARLIKGTEPDFRARKVRGPEK